MDHFIEFKESESFEDRTQVNKEERRDSRLNKFAYLSKEALPGAADALIYQKLKDCQKMPTKEKYFNFHHWYNTMCQFAGKEIDKWIKSKTKVEDKLILDSLSLLNTIKPTLPKERDIMVNYMMNIFLKDEIENSFENTQSKLLSINPLKIGEELIMSFKPPQGRSIENLNEIWITFKMSPAACEILKDIVSNWPEVKNIQIKKIMKEKRA